MQFRGLLWRGKKVERDTKEFRVSEWSRRCFEGRFVRNVFVPRTWKVESILLRWYIKTIYEDDCSMRGGGEEKKKKKRLEGWNDGVGVDRWIEWIRCSYSLDRDIGILTLDLELNFWTRSFSRIVVESFCKIRRETMCRW